MMHEDLNLNKNDLKILIGLLIFNIVLVSYYIVFNANLGIYCSDVYIYLLNALYYTGININSTLTIHLSPIICFLTSLLFRLGFIDKISIYIVTGIFAIFGNIGLYLLLKTRFDTTLSLTGSIIYSTFAINLTWLANGSLDVAATSISIWIMLFTILAMKKNPKYYIYMIVFFVIGFFTRYTVILLFPVILLCYLYENSFKINKKDLKYILLGLGIGILITIIILIKISNMGGGNLGFEGQIAGGVGGSHGSVKDAAYNTEITYYLYNLGNFISASNTIFIKKTPALENQTILTGLIFLILIIGTVLWIKKSNFKMDSYNISGIILCLIALTTFNQFSSFITIIITFLGLLLLGKNSENKNGLVMAGWFLVYFIFFSYYSIKVNRYLIPALPALTYLIIASIELINEKVKKKNLIQIVLIILFVIQGFTFTLTFEDTNEFNAPENISEYIISNVDNWSNLKIGVYNMRPYHWYLGENVTGIETSNTELIENSNVSYYISNKQILLENYTQIKKIDDIYLYEKISD